jgi:hypothetical protein
MIGGLSAIEILIFGLFVLAQLADLYTTQRALKLKALWRATALSRC